MGATAGCGCSGVQPGEQHGDEDSARCSGFCSTSRPSVGDKACSMKMCCADDGDIIARAHPGDARPIGGFIQNHPADVQSPPEHCRDKQPAPKSQCVDKRPASKEKEVEANYFDRDREELITLRQLPVPTKSGQIHLFKSGSTYVGQWGVNGARHGYGKMTWSDGVIYEGQWDDNVAAGKGRFQHIDGDQYIGEWRKNMANGKGVYYHGGVQTYIGEWCDDMQHGIGIECWNEGASYQGEFNKSHKDGCGRYMWEDGCCEYLGTWKNNVIEGYGACIATDGRTFCGYWKQSAMHGIGKYVWPDGKEYRGQYWFDKKDGFGILREANGDVLHGFWAQGAPDAKTIIQGDALPSEV